MLSKVDLPQPEWPMIETYSPLLDGQRDVLEHLADDAAAKEALVEVVDLKIAGHVLPPNQLAAVPRVTKVAAKATIRSRMKPVIPT